jgi:hypothetical protein
MPTNCFFTAPLALSAELPAEGAPSLPGRFSGVAYSGGVVPGWEGSGVIDLSSTSIASDLPLLYQHNHGQYIGLVQGANDGRELKVTGELFTDLDEQAKAIAAKARRGVKWQLSIGLFDASLEEHKGAVQVNGRSFQGPITVLKGGAVREISIVALGADRATHTEFFSVHHQENPSMPPIEHQDGELAELKAQAAALTARAEAAEQALDAERRNARALALSALYAELGRPCPEAAKPHYLAMSAEAFAAFAAELRAVQPKLGEHLFSEQAKGEPGKPEESPLNIREIYAHRRAAQ